MKPKIKTALPLAMVLILWQLASMAVSPLFVPSPASVLDEFVSLLTNGQLVYGLVYSFWRITAASLLAAAVSLPLGMLVFYSSTAKAIILPITNLMRFLPITAFYPLLILWFGIGEQMKISFLFLATFVYMLPSVVLAFQEVSPDLMLTARTLSMNRFQILTMVLLPSTLPSILQTFTMMYGIGWTYIAVCEQINAKYGIGYIIYTSTARGRTAISFAGILTIILVSMAFDWLANKLIRHFSPGGSKMLTLHELTVGYDTPLLGPVSGSFDGSITGIMAPSGKGKTTLFKTLCSVIQPFSGSFQASAPVTMMCQHNTNFDWLTCLDNVLICDKIQHKPQKPTLAREMLATVGLLSHQNDYPASFPAANSSASALPASFI